MSDYASLCVLSYNRPEFLAQCIESARDNAGYPFELIVHDDGSTDPEVHRLLAEYLYAGIVSTVISNAPGHNQGVGLAMNRMFQLASGDPIIKLDQDLVFAEDWLRKTVSILDENQLNSPQAHDGHAKEPRIGALGAFHYGQPPVDHRQMFKARHGLLDKKWEEHWDFVGSFIAVPADVYRKHGPFEVHSDAFAEDISFKRKLQAEGYALGLPPEDLVVNVGFGPPHSTVVTAFDPETRQGEVQAIHHGPRVHA